MSHAALLAAVATWCFVCALIGSALGLILGTIRLPILLLLASSPAAGAAANIGVSAVSAAAASITHIRARRVNWRLFAWMTPPSILGALVGGYVSGVLPSRILLAAIGGLLVWFGVRMLLPRSRPQPRPEGSRLNIRAAVITGVSVGVLGGLVGLILSTLRVPAMIRHVGETPQKVIGTNVVVGFWLGVAGVIGHLPSGVDWDLMLLGSIASIPGALIGSRMTGRLSEPQLLRSIGVVLLIVGSVTVGQALVA